MPELLAAHPTDVLRKLRAQLTGVAGDTAGLTAALASFARLVLDREITHPDRRARDAVPRTAHSTDPLPGTAIPDPTPSSALLPDAGLNSA